MVNKEIVDALKTMGGILLVLVLVSALAYGFQRFFLTERDLSPESFSCGTTGMNCK